MKKQFREIGVLVVLVMFFVLGFTTAVSAGSWDVGGNDEGGGGTSKKLGLTSNNALHIITNDNTQMIITPSGNFGIGVADPSNKFDIFDSDSTADRVCLKVGQSGTMSGTGYAFYATKTGKATTNIAGYFSATEGTSNNYGLIVENGNVGIGTATPSYMLDIKARLSIGSPTFGGSGLDDMTTWGTCTGSVEKNYKVEIDGEALQSAITLANSLKASYNAHIACSTCHSSPGTPDTVNDITSSDATDLDSLKTLVEEMLTDYDAHDDDAEQGTPTYHPATEASDHSLSSTESPNDLDECVARLNDFKASFNDHDADSTCHGGGASHHQDSTTDAYDDDTFKWSDDGGDTWDATGVTITGSDQILNEGVTVTFVADDGHTLTDYWTFSTSAINPFSIQDIGGTRIFHIGNDGKVGIRDTTPDAALDIYYTGGDPFIRVDDGGGGDGYPFIIDNEKEVGIGTDSPEVKLHVYAGDSTALDPGADSVLCIENDDEADLQFLGPNDHEQGINFGDPESATIGSIKYQHSANRMLFTTNDIIAMTIDNSQRIGIGTDVPQKELHVANSGDTSIRIEDSSISKYTTLVQAASDGDFYITRLGTGGADLSIQSDGDLIIGQQGNVGIGTASPVTPLHILTDNAGANIDLITFDRTTTSPADGDSYDLIFNHENSVNQQKAYAQIRLIASDVTELTEDGALAISVMDESIMKEVIRISDSGYVGIGMNSPNEKLTIEGAISLDELSSTPSATSGYGKLYVDSSGKLWYKDESSNTFDLTNVGSDSDWAWSSGSGLTGDIYRTGKVRIAQMATPTISSVIPVQESGGTLSGWNYYRVVAIDGGTGKTLGSTEVGANVVSPNNAATISWGAVTGACYYRVYGRASGAQNTYWNVYSLSYTDKGSSGTGGSVPASNTAWITRVSPSSKSWINGGDVRIRDWLEIGNHIGAGGYYGGIKFMGEPRMTSVYNEMIININSDNVQSDQGNFIIQKAGTNKVTFEFGSGDSYINVIGDLGIGTTSPSSKLDINGDIEIGGSNEYYLGDPNTNNSWRIKRSSDDLIFQQRESGVWNTKHTISGA